MRKKKTRAEKDRVGHYLWMLHQFGEQDAAIFFPDLHRRFIGADEPQVERSAEGQFSTLAPRFDPDDTAST